MDSAPQSPGSPTPDGVASKPIRVVWGDASGLRTVYANNLFVTHTENQFYVVFGELLMPLILDANAEKDRLPDTIEIKPVARIAVSPEAMEKFAEAISGNVKKFRSRQRGDEEGQDR